jgi:hypothetical protein
MLQNLKSFYFWNQKFYLKTKSYLNQIWKKKDSFNPLYFWQV